MKSSLSTSTADPLRRQAESGDDEVEVARLTRELERSRQELDQFVYVASHDLKAPLRGIITLSQWLEEDLGPALTGETRHQLDLLRRRVQRMERLLESLLQYSRAARIRGAPERVEIAPLLREVAAQLTLQPPAQLLADPELPPVFCVRAALQQVFLQLVSNALRHARKEDVRIRVRARDEGECIRFTVADDGPGIAPEFHQRIWGVFQTLEARDTVEGTGIGLPIVQKLVEGRGGRAWVESTLGEGSRFHFTWPRTEAPRHDPR